MGLEEYTGKKIGRRIEAADEEARGPSFEEIQQDDRMWDLFGAMLRQRGKTDLAEKLLSRGAIRMSMDDIRSLEPERKAFVEKLTALEEVERDLTPEMMERIADVDPDGFGAILNLKGGEKIKTMLLGTMDSMAMKDPEHFDAIYKSMKNVISTERRDEEKTDELQKLGETYKVSAETFKKIVQEKNETRRRELIRTTFKETWEGQYPEWSFWNYFGGSAGEKAALFKSREAWQKRKEVWLKEKEDTIAGLVRGGSRDIGRITRETGRQRSEAEGIQQAIENARKEAGGALVVAFENNKDLSEALARFLGGEEELEKEEATAMTEIRDEVPSRTKASEICAEYMKEHNLSSSAFAGMSDQGREQHLEGLANKMSGPLKNRLKSKKGSWAEILGSGSFLKNLIKAYELF